VNRDHVDSAARIGYPQGDAAGRMGEQTDILVIGAGAAGLMCAIEAGRRGRRVLVIDHAQKPAEKIRISGGGRCNFTNLDASPKQFLSENPHFCISALRRFTPRDFIARVDAKGIAWHEKTLGQLFCDGSAKQIVDMLLDDLKAAGGELRLGVEPGAIERAGEGFVVETSVGAMACASLVIATGGKSIPKMGSTGYAYAVAAAFGLKIVEPRPALVPFTFVSPQLEPMAELAGLAVEARVSCGKTGFDDGLLFTHRGLSGPSILQISSYWRAGDAVVIDLARGRDVFEALKRERKERPRLQLDNALAMIVPRRLADQIAARSFATMRLADLSDAKLRAVAAAVNAWRVTPDGTEGWRTAEVTIGGVDTDGLSSRTMQAQAVAGLYFIGECVDVTGWLGGYNFQWAWSSGWAAGQVA
jgi:predicted Rossmann fold flavoprotein